jgi:Metallo-peptidase family M12B Reprolysin-like
MSFKNFRYFLSSTVVLLSLSGMVFAEPASSDGLWRETKSFSVAATPQMPIVPSAYRTVTLKQSAFAALLATAPMEFSDKAKSTAVVITLPKPDGSFARFRIEESPMISPKVAAEVPDWKTYSGRNIDDPASVVRFSWSNAGLKAAVLQGDGMYYVDPISANDLANYICYSKTALKNERIGFHCSLDEYLSTPARSAARPVSPDGVNAALLSNGTNLKTYRLAIATTHQYTADRGGQDAAFTDVMNAVNRINLVYRRDVSVSFTLVSDKRSVISDTMTDPYNNTDQVGQLAINQTQLDNIYGTANYDIGHLFGTGGGGVATSPSICSTQKAEGYSARVPPTGDPFWVDYVAHEMGHQLSAQHTYNTNENGGCNTRSAADAYEVASGVTIMGYNGVCSDRNLQQFSIDNFHVRTLDQIIAELGNQGGGGSCGTTTATNNNIPTANAGANFTIPKLTPFTLTATASDADAGDALTYSWEEFDLAPSASGPQGVPAGTYDVDTDNVLRPLFRTYSPIASASRTYPSLTYILNNANVPPLTYTGTSATGATCPGTDTCVVGENLPSVARTMNFRVVVRDNKGGVADGATQINVRGDSGPFKVSAPNTAVSVTGGSQFTVTWDVANTTAAPVSAANVKISLSTDGGNNFSTILTASTPNDGTETLTIPNIATTTARIKVEAVGNIFFDVSDVNFTITGNGATPGLVGNVSTRLPVGTDDNVLIEGFIVQGPAGSTKKIIVRAIGPTLAGFGVTDALANPTLDIFDSNNAKVATNNDWKNTQIGGLITSDQFAEINSSGVAPTNDLESAIIANLAPGSYTAVVRGLGNTTGTGVVDAFDLSAASPARLANIATRGLIQPGDKLMIAGFIIQNGAIQTVVRAIGPSLTAFGVTNALPDTTLQVKDQNGATVIENDDWQTSQKQALEATGLQPTNNLEAAVVVTLQPGQYTAQVRGKPEATGTGVVQAYFLQ